MTNEFNRWQADMAAAKSNKKMAYGGVVFDADGNVLLREPRNHFGGYAWTFPKGRQDPGQSPEKTALREVEEETGVLAEIIGKVPGSFEGDVTITEFFLMRSRSKGQFGWETQQVRWMPPEEARKLIGQTPNTIGRERDWAILDTALMAYEGLHDK